MKQMFLLIIVLLAGNLISLHGQNALYTLRFDLVNNEPGNGYVKIYDNETIEIYGNGKESFHHTFSFVSLSLVLDNFLCLYSISGNTDTKYAKPYIMLMGGSNAMYIEATPNDTIVNTLRCSNENSNDNVYASLLKAYENKTDVFANFRSISDLELPLSIEGWTSAHTVDIPSDQGEKAYSVRTKSGKYVNETEVGEYEVWTDANWLTIRTQTDAAFLLKWEANTTGTARSANVYVKGKDKTTQMTVSQPALRVAIEQVWVEHNKLRGLVKGMKIHVKFSTYGVRGITGNCAAYFSFANGTRLMDYNGAFRAMDGQVSCGGSFVPNYDSCVFNDYELFMPYTELHINGKADCKFQVQVMIGGQYASSQDVSFSVY